MVDLKTFKCRKLNNFTINPNHTKDYFLELVKNRNSECTRTLVQIGLAEPMNVNKYGVESKFKSSKHMFHPSRNIPPTNPNDDVNISPVESKTFCECQSMQNCQLLMYTNGCNKYCCKYVVKVDKKQCCRYKNTP